MIAIRQLTQVDCGVNYQNGDYTERHSRMYLEARDNVKTAIQSLLRCHMIELSNLADIVCID